jgi:hypothetical protein
VSEPSGPARTSPPIQPDLAQDLDYLATSLEALPIENGVDEGRLADRRDWIVRTIRHYLIPRFEHPTTPLVVVFAGPTGAGKSTLVNSITGHDHTLAGPLRPTTKEPVVLSSEERAEDYRHIGGVSCDVVTGRAPILDELILVDTPDIDSTSVDHRAMAETMIDNADVVVYVSSALRYSDLVPWEVLRRAQSRGVPLIPVLNRIRASSRGALSDYTSMLHAGGLEADVVAVQEHHVDPGAQAISSPAIQELRDRHSSRPGRSSTWRRRRSITRSSGAPMSAGCWVSIWHASARGVKRGGAQVSICALSPSSAPGGSAPGGRSDAAPPAPRRWRVPSRRSTKP